jgi:hypothetical protein
LTPVPRPGAKKPAESPAAEEKPNEPKAAKKSAPRPPQVTLRKPKTRATGIQFVAAPLLAQAEPPAEPEKPTQKPPVDSEKPADESAANAVPAEPTQPDSDSAKPMTDDEGSAAAGAPEIVVSVGPGGITIASEDLDALDEFEEQLRMFIDNSATGKEFNIYYLRYAKADTAASLLTEILSGGTASSGDEGGGSLMGDLASQMIGGMGGDLLGGLLGGPSGGTGAASGTVSIIPDPRLNALVVQATARDLDSIEQLLDVIDRPDSGVPVETTPMPKFIPVIYSSAEEIATIIRQVFASKMMAEAGGQQRQPSPEDFIRALRGGGRGGSGGRQQNRGEEQKMTIGVDPKSNSLIVSAPDYLFNQVKDMVYQLDQAAVASRSDETVRVVNLKRASTDLVQRSLVSVLGPSASVNKTASTTSTSSTGRTSSSTSSQGSRTTSSNTGSQGGDNRSSDGGSDAMRRFMESQEMMRRFQEAAGASSRGGDRGSSRGSFGGDRGGSSRGGFGGDRGGSSRGGFGGFPGGGRP